MYSGYTFSDFYNDGDMDILSKRVNNNSFYFYKNTGSLNFTEYQIDIAESVYTTSSDIDNDGNTYIVIISPSYNGSLGSVAWLRNSGTLSNTESILDRITLYPNPIIDILNLQSSVDISNVKIYNKLGQLVALNFNKKQIGLSSLPTGVYYCRIESKSGEVSNIKVMKQ